MTLLRRHSSPAPFKPYRPKLRKRAGSVSGRLAAVVGFCAVLGGASFLQDGRVWHQVTTTASNLVAVSTGTAVLIDGDTISVNGERIRLADIDAPESYESRCDEELVLGLKAKERLRTLLDGGPLRIERTGTDRYGRTLARVFAGGRDLGQALVSEGYALRYQPGPAAKEARTGCAAVLLTSLRLKSALEGP
jgi:micrococcal nuclease